MTQIGGMLTGSKIIEEYDLGRIEIDNFDKACVNPNSYDLKIGNTYKTIESDQKLKYCAAPQSLSINDIVIPIDELSLKEPIEYEEHEISDEGVVLYPGTLYLIPTLNKIHTDYYIPIITGRSSMGRAGISVHKEAGFGDIGFNGSWTLQVTVTYPIRIFKNIRMAQVYFITPYGDIDMLYHGKYQNSDTANGSKAYLDFK